MWRVPFPLSRPGSSGRDPVDLGARRDLRRAAEQGYPETVERQEESLWLTRMRWRMRGAWLWPVFIALTVAEGAARDLLPVSGDGPAALPPGVLLAGFANLIAVAVIAPLAGARLRRRRPDLPRVIADNYAGTALLCAGALAILAAGLVHRPQVLAERADRGAVVGAVHDYVVAQAPGYRDGIASAEAVRLEDDLYRACVPGSDPRRWLCLFVSTDQRPAGVTVDADRSPNQRGPARESPAPSPTRRPASSTCTTRSTGRGRRSCCCT